MNLLEFTERGVYCQKAGVFIDPWKGVPKALITHAHSDHAQPGCQQYLSTHRTAYFLRHRLGLQQNIQSVAFGESINIHGVKFSFHPAGHIVGSAQIRVEHNGEVWVVSGDYKTEPDHVSENFQVIRCHTFITESTFGLPVYQWPEQAQVFSEINAWWESNSQQGITSVLSAYSLGKSQRIIQNVDHSIGPVYCHSSIEATNEVVRQAGVKLKETLHLSDNEKKENLRKALVIAPGSALSSSWMRRFKEYTTAAASGWMILRGRKKWQHVDNGFVLSDHADWNALNATVKATGCERVVVTHGYSDIYAQWLQGQGYHAQPEKTTYEDENEEIG